MTWTELQSEQQQNAERLEQRTALLHRLRDVHATLETRIAELEPQALQRGTRVHAEDQIHELKDQIALLRAGQRFIFDQTTGRVPVAGTLPDLDFLNAPGIPAIPGMDAVEREISDLEARQAELADFFTRWPSAEHKEPVSFIGRVGKVSRPDGTYFALGDLTTMTWDALQGKVNLFELAAEVSVS